MSRTDLMPVTPSAVYLPDHLARPGLSLMQVVAIGRAWWRRTALIVCSMIVSVALVSIVMPKTYTATATVIVNYEVNDPLAGREFPISLMGNYMATQVELLKSPEVLMAVVQRLDLVHNEDYADGFDGDGAALNEWVASKLAKKLEVGQGKYGGQLIYVTFSADKPQLAANIANTIVEVYSEQLHQRAAGPASEHAKRYAHELEELKQKVGRARDQVTQFRQQHNLVDVEAKADIDVAMLDALEQRRLEAATARRVAESKLAANPAVSQPVMDSLLVQSLRTRLSTLEAQMAELRSTLGSRHPQVLEVQSQIDATRRSLSAEEGRYRESASGDLTSSVEFEKKMGEAVETQRSRLLGVRKLQDEASKYVLELNSAESAYKRALDGYDQVMIASSGQYTNVGFASRATPPPRPSRPRLLINLLFAVLLGGALGMVLPFVCEMLSRRVRCRDDLERDHGVPVLAEFGPYPALSGAAL